MSTPEPRTETAERDESRHDTRDDARPASEAPRPAHDEARADERPAMNRDGVPLARVRRAPRVMPFLLTGAVIGALAGLFVSLDGGDGGNYTASSSTGYLVVLFAALGTLLGGLAFVVADRRS
ncbi:MULTISPECIES: hypothetical protein [Dermacoccus]|uniref:hypothetical protein n=1 Tax=Dermacoccus TaxID=57495 RepID=UPI0011A9C7A6|nr:MULTISPECIES: hypothetical protein [Dermacoccus]MBO1758368.1 hypothetical protein [Dermacoccus sp. NHGro5]